MFCNQCGKEIPENSQFCPFCGKQQQKSGQKIEQKENPSIDEVEFAKPQEEEKEKTYYSDSNNVRVTKTRHIANGTTYVLKKIESVSFLK